MLEKTPMMRVIVRIFLLTALLELFLKVYFLLPFPKIIDVLTDKAVIRKDLMRWVKWDKSLNYKLSANTAHIEKYAGHALISEEFEVSTNDDGFRYPPKQILREFDDTQKRKIICLGDSWTMGWGVNWENSYPAQLQKILNSRMPDRFTVINLGIISYTSFQGLAIVRKIISSLKAEDIVILGYGINDSRSSFLVRSFGRNALLDEKTFNDIVFHPAGGFTTFKLLRLIFASALNQDYSKKSLYPFWDYLPRVAYADYFSNCLQMVKLIKKKGARPILLFHGAFEEEEYTAKALYEISKLTEVPVIDVNRIYHAALNHQRDYIDSKYANLKRHSSYPFKLDVGLEGKICFRVLPSPYIDKLKLKADDISKVRVAMLSENGRRYYIKTFELNDNGFDGDEIADDGIWSGRVCLRPDIKLLRVLPKYIAGKYNGEYAVYSYFFLQLIDRFGRRYNECSDWAIEPLPVSFWRYLEVGKIINVKENAVKDNEIFKHKVLFYQEIMMPIAFFGKQVMKSDFWHPTKCGYRMFAEEIFAIIKNTL